MSMMMVKQEHAKSTIQCYNYYIMGAKGNNNPYIFAFNEELFDLKEKRFLVFRAS